MAFANAGLHRVCSPMLDDLGHLPGPQREALETVFGLKAGTSPDPFVLAPSPCSAC
jgi:hypothetical protein